MVDIAADIAVVAAVDIVVVAADIAVDIGVGCRVARAGVVDSRVVDRVPLDTVGPQRADHWKRVRI